MSRKVKDLTGQESGRLTAIRRVGSKSGRALWLCRCSCNGKEIKVRSYCFVSGNTQSCGCLKRELFAARTAARHGKNYPSFKHGFSPSRTYKSWAAMIRRTTNTNHQRWLVYGGAGGTVCERWRDFRSFLSDMGERPVGTSLGRFGDVGPYCKENCAWQTRAEQTAEHYGKKAMLALHAFHEAAKRKAA